MSKLEVDKVTPQSGTTLTIGEAGDTTVMKTLKLFQIFLETQLEPTFYGAQVTQALLYL